MNDHSNTPRSRVLQGPETAHSRFEWYEQITADGLAGLVGIAHAIAQQHWRVSYVRLGEIVHVHQKTAEQQVRKLIQRGHLLRKKGGARWGVNAVNQYAMIKMSPGSENTPRRSEEDGAKTLLSMERKHSPVRGAKTLPDSPSQESPLYGGEPREPAASDGGEPLRCATGLPLQGPKKGKTPLFYSDPIPNQDREILNHHESPLPNQQRATEEPSLSVGFPSGAAAHGGDKVKGGAEGLRVRLFCMSCDHSQFGMIDAGRWDTEELHSWVDQLKCNGCGVRGDANMENLGPTSGEVAKEPSTPKTHQRPRVDDDGSSGFDWDAIPLTKGDGTQETAAERDARTAREHAEKRRQDDAGSEDNLVPAATPRTGLKFRCYDCGRTLSMKVVPDITDEMAAKEIASHLECPVCGPSPRVLWEATMIVPEDTRERRTRPSAPKLVPELVPVADSLDADSEANRQTKQEAAGGYDPNEYADLCGGGSLR
jgi:hypothetical protein